MKKANSNNMFFNHGKPFHIDQCSMNYTYLKTGENNYKKTNSATINSIFNTGAAVYFCEFSIC